MLRSKSISKHCKYQGSWLVRTYEHVKIGSMKHTQKRECGSWGETMYTYTCVYIYIHINYIYICIYIYRNKTDISVQNPYDPRIVPI